MLSGLVCFLVLASSSALAEEWYMISEKELTSIEQNLAEQSAALERLNAALDTQNASLTTLRKSLETSRKRLTDSEQTIRRLETHLTQASGISATLRRQVLRLRLQAGTLRATHDRLAKRFQEFESVAQQEIRRWQRYCLLAGGGGAVVGFIIGVIVMVVH